MKIGFSLDGQIIEGDFTGARDWHFTTTNDYVKQFYPSGNVRWMQVSLEPVPGESGEYKIWAKLAKIGEDYVCEILAGILEQDYLQSKLSCEKLNSVNTISAVRYVIAPGEKGDNRNITDYKAEYQSKENTDFYTPGDCDEIAFYEVITTENNGVKNYNFNQVFSKIVIN